MYVCAPHEKLLCIYISPYVYFFDSNNSTFMNIYKIILVIYE